MLFNVGDYVTRKSYKNDIVFEIIRIDNDIAYLKGCSIRLYADSNLSDLESTDSQKVKEDYERILNGIDHEFELDRNEFFFLPGKVLHIDSDKKYLEKCLELYDKLNVMAYGVMIDEDEIYLKINDYLNKYRPDIVVITGHDAYYKNQDKHKNESYKNSDNFIKAIKEARYYEKNQEKLIIIAGACQSNYEELIKSGANFASSPKRVNIHALDPAIIASSIALSEKNKPIDIVEILQRTKYKESGMGGIITGGTMYRGYPR